MAINEGSLEQLHRARQLAALNNISTLLSVTLDPAQVLESVTASMVELTRSAGGAVLLYPDDDSQALTVVQTLGDLPSMLDGLPPILLLSETAFYDQSPFTFINIETDLLSATLRELFRREGFIGLIELPLMVGSELLGEMVAYFRNPPNYSDEDIEFLRIFSNQAGLSINHARLHARTDRALQQRITQISALATINQELTATLDLDHLFNLVLDRAISATRSATGVLLLRPERTSDPMRVVAQRGEDKRRTAELLQRPAVYRSLTSNGSIIEHGNHPELSVPISHEGDILGVIALTGQGRHEYTQQDVEFVQQLANQALIAIDNARLFRRIEESRSGLQVILDSMRDAVLLIDLNGTILLANPEIEVLFGLRVEHINGKTLHFLLTEPRQRYARQLGFNSEALRTLVQQVGEGIAPDLPLHTYHIDQPMTRYIERTVVPTRNSDGSLSGVLMVFSNVTRQHEESQAREDLSKMIVHDLRSPLTAISTSLKLLSEIGSEDASIGSLIDRTTDASQRALRKVLNLVDSILDIAKMEGGTITLDRAAHSLRSVGETIREELLPIARELEIHIDIVMPRDLPPALIDHIKMERVILNLVDNALKYAPVDGHVQIRAMLLDQDMIRVEVADNGPGIPDDYKLRIFDRFQQVAGSRGRRRGTGLGLTFCKLTVEVHGGQIWIEDNPGGGSIFVFTVPVAKTG